MQVKTNTKKVLSNNQHKTVSAKPLGSVSKAVKTAKPSKPSKLATPKPSLSRALDGARELQASTRVRTGRTIGFGENTSASSAAAGVAAATRIAAASSVVDRLGGSGAVKVVDQIGRKDHGRITPYGKSPWQGKVLELEVVDPKRLASNGRLHTAAGETRFGRWGALADDVKGLSPNQLNRRFNLDAAKGAGQLPDQFSTRLAKAGDRIRVGREGAARVGASRLTRSPLQLEYLDYPGRNATGATRAGFLNRFGAPSALDDAGRGVQLLDDVARVGGGAADDVARGAKALGAARGAGRILGKAALPLAVAVAGFDVYSTWRAEGSFGRESRKALGRGIGGIAGGAAGGALVGAAIGSVVPGVGTIIGGALGGIVGGIAGSKLGEWIAGDGIDIAGRAARSVGRAASSAVDAAYDAAESVTDAVEHASDAVGDAVGDAAKGAASAAGDAAHSVGKAIGGLFG